MGHLGCLASCWSVPVSVTHLLHQKVKHHNTLTFLSCRSRNLCSQMSTLPQNKRMRLEESLFGMFVHQVKQTSIVDHCAIVNRKSLQ